MAIVSFEIISVPVADQQRSKVFYQEILGFNLLREESMGPSGGKWIQLAPPGCATTITLVTWFDSMKPGGLQGVMLNSSDIDGDHRCSVHVDCSFPTLNSSLGADTRCLRIQTAMAGFCVSRLAPEFRPALASAQQVHHACAYLAVVLFERP